MKTRNNLTPSEVAVVKAEWMRPKGERPTQVELAHRFNVAEVTVRRALAEEGLLELAGYKTKKDTEILEFLKSQGLNELNALRKFVTKARTGKHGK